LLYWQDFFGEKGETWMGINGQNTRRRSVINPKERKTKRKWTLEGGQGHLLKRTAREKNLKGGGDGGRRQNCVSQRKRNSQ